MKTKNTDRTKNNLRVHNLEKRIEELESADLKEKQSK